MKRIPLLLLAAFFAPMCIFAQSVGINDNGSTPNSSTMLHVNTTNKVIPAIFETNSYLNWTAWKNKSGYVGYVGPFNDSLDMDFGTYYGNTTGDVNLVTYDIPRLTVKPSGEVCIGTEASNGYSQLVVKSNSTYPVEIETTTENNFLGWKNPTGYVGYAGVFNNPRDMDFGTWANNLDGDVNLVTYDIPRLTVKPSGNVGVGLEAPLATLHTTQGSTFNNNLTHEFYGGWGTNAAILGEATSNVAGQYAENIGVFGYAAGGDAADLDYNIGGGFDAVGTGAASAFGVFARGSGANTNYGIVSSAIGSTNSTNYGIYSSANGGSDPYAGFFSGNVYVNGTLAKAGGTFKIDHPQDPANKYLVHSFVESPDMMNIYNGNITTDANGVATVIMPTYFEALNREFRYQITPIGTFAQVIVKEEINGNTFVIQTDKPNVKVSWQVTGVRQDAWANANRVQPEVIKTGNDAGRYLMPELFGKTDADAIDPVRRSAAQGKMLTSAKTVNNNAPTAKEMTLQPLRNTAEARPMPTPANETTPAVETTIPERQ